MLENGCSPVTEPPWVIVLRGVRGINRSVAGRNVIRLPKRKLCKMGHIPDQVKNYCFLGSSNGWVGLQNRQLVYIVHVLSGTVVRLPDLTTIPGVEAIPDAEREGVTAGLAFSSPAGGGVGGGGGDDDVGMKRFVFRRTGPRFVDLVSIVPPTGAGTSTTLAAVADRELTVLAVSHNMRRLFFVRPRVDDAWSLVDMPAPVGDHIEGITIYRGSVCAVDIRGLVAAWDYCRVPAAGDVKAVPQFKRVVIPSGPPLDLGGVDTADTEDARYLVEANGDLLQVKRNLFRTTGGWWKTTAARVFRLEEEEEEDVVIAEGGHSGGERKTRWVPVRRMGGGGGDISIFVGKMSSAAFSCDDFPWLEKNCIYFTEQFSTSGFPDGCHDRGVYHLRTRTMRHFRPFRCHRTWFDGVWFIPML